MLNLSHIVGEGPQWSSNGCGGLPAAGTVFRFAVFCLVIIYE
jgi:hypothetical protein